jgi:hypothetical protein
MAFTRTTVIHGITYTIKAPSRRKGKKYDVYVGKDDPKYLLSYGGLGYEQYKDAFGYYKDLDHNDAKRRKLYRDRHHKDFKDDPSYAGYWAWNFLW